MTAGPVGTQAGFVAGALVLEASGDQITAVGLISNPDKLGFASRQVARLSRLSPVIGL